jgi:hypothetical protein
MQEKHHARDMPGIQCGRESRAPGRAGFASRMIKDKCAAIINDEQCGHTREQEMTSRPMTVDQMSARG